MCVRTTKKKTKYSFLIMIFQKIKLEIQSDNKYINRHIHVIIQFSFISICEKHIKDKRFLHILVCSGVLLFFLQFRYRVFSEGTFQHFLL